MEVVNPSVMVSRLDLVVLDSAAAGIDFRQLLWGFWNSGVFIKQRGSAGGHRWWVVAPSGHPQVLLWPILGVLVHKKSPRSFAVFGLRLILISCDVKTSKKQQLALGTMSIG